jgi:hypothetical protein
MRTLALPIAAVLLAACANSPTPNYDAKFGDAVRNARQAMTLNPNAGASGNPVAGMDGKAAAEAVGRYHDSFKTPPPPVNVINIGGAIGQGGN